MTAIAGFVDGSTVWVGADSSITDCDYTATNLIEKAFIVGPYVVGGSGDLRTLQVLRYSWNPPNPPRSRDKLSEFMCSDFVGTISKALTSAGVDLGSADFGLVVGVKARIFEIADDLSVVEPMDGIAASGSGRDLALGSLLSTTRWKNPVDRISMALEAAASRNAHVRSPWTIVHL